MKAIIVVLALMLCTVPMHATTPIIEPFPDAFARFEKTYPQQCASLLAEVQSRLKQPRNENIVHNLEGMVLYVENLQQGARDVRRAMADKNARIPLKEAVFRLVTDISGFRRSLDVVMIEGTASKSLVLDEAFLKNARRIWDDDYYYSWLFAMMYHPRREESAKK